MRNGLHTLPNNVKKLPIPIIKIDKQQQPFIDLVNKILVKKENNENTDQEENAIDFLVYKLYELTYDEVKIIDTETPINREEYEGE